MIKSLRISGLLLPILAPLLLLALIAKYGVNVPFWDEWGIPGSFLALETHTFADFFAQSNESRLVVPKFLFLVASKFIGWQPKHYMYFGWLIVVFTFVLNYCLCYHRISRRSGHDWISLLCLSLSSILLFSPAAYENWLWGLQWVIFVPLLCALFSVWIQHRSRSFAYRFTATVLLNTVAMFSFSNGMLLWVISYPFWNEGLRLFFGRGLLKRQLLRFALWTSAYLLTAGIFLRFYFADYQSISAHPPLTFVFEQPLTVLKYFAVWCAGPFQANTLFRIVLGTLFILSVLFLLVRLTLFAPRKGHGHNAFQLRMLYPSIIIIVYAFGSGLMTSLGRAAFGLEQAVSPRYLFHSGVLSVGLIAAFNAIRIIRGRTQKEERGYLGVFVAVVVLLTFLSCRAWRHGYKQLEPARLARLETLLTVRMLSLAPTGLLVERTCPWLNLPSLVRTLQAKRIYDPTSFGEWLLSEIKAPSMQNGGSFAISRSKPSDISVLGWGILPDANTPADFVLVCRKNAAGILEPAAMLPIGFTRDDVARKTGKPALRKSGFASTFPWTEALDVTSIAFFSVDERNKRLFPLTLIP